MQNASSASWTCLYKENIVQTSNTLGTVKMCLMIHQYTELHLCYIIVITIIDLTVLFPELMTYFMANITVSKLRMIK